MERVHGRDPLIPTWAASLPTSSGHMEARCATAPGLVTYVAWMSTEPDIAPGATVSGSCRLAVAVQQLDHLDGLEVAYVGYRLADGSIAAWAEHDGVILAVTVMPDGGAILMGTYADMDAAVRAARRVQAWRRWADR